VWQKRIKKTIYTLAVDNWAPEITRLTFPLLMRYADKIGADFHVISGRLHPDWPITYEKFQVYDLGRLAENDWNIYIDADALIHPETPDFTLYLTKDTVAHTGNDAAPIRWRYDRYFLRDGRDIGSCNWFTIGSDWCIDLWHPVDDLTPQEAIDSCFPTMNEEKSGIVTPYHLIDDFLIGRNIARFGLKFAKLNEIIEKRYSGSWFFWHQYTIPVEQKVAEMKKILNQWGLA
jgi:hypothetical protein